MTKFSQKDSSAEGRKPDKRNKSYAELCADMLTRKQRECMEVACGIRTNAEVSEETLNELINLSLLRRDVNLLNNSDVAILTDFGKRVKAILLETSK